MSDLNDAAGRAVREAADRGMFGTVDPFAPDDGPQAQALREVRRREDDCGCGPIALTGVHGPGCRLGRCLCTDTPIRSSRDHWPTCPKYGR